MDASAPVRQLHAWYPRWAKYTNKPNIHWLPRTNPHLTSSTCQLNRFATLTMTSGRAPSPSFPSSAGLPHTPPLDPSHEPA
eukprot:483232-Pleurochrysis_carterae.AAC.1